MAHTLIDIFNNIIKYDDNKIIVVLDKKGNALFSGLQVAKILGYNKYT
jgi:prophage antirepressor-like protein